MMEIYVPENTTRPQVLLQGSHLLPGIPYTEGGIHRKEVANYLLDGFDGSP